MLPFCIAALVIAYVVYRGWQFKRQVRSEVGWTKASRGKRVGYIYFFRGASEPFWMVKIGRTNNPVRRLKAHRTANPHGILVLAVFKTKDDVKAERILHETFAGSRMNPRNEWFYLSLDMLFYMWALRDRGLTDKVQSWLR